MILFQRRAEVDEKRLRELEDTVRMKNKQIHQLLEDIEQVNNHSTTKQLCITFCF